MSATSSSQPQESVRVFQSEDARLSIRVTDSEDGVLVERDHVNPGLPRIAHAMLFCSAHECQDWWQADPLRLSYPPVYVSVARQVTEWLDRSAPGIRAPDPSTLLPFDQRMPALIGEMHSAPDVTHLLAALRSTLTAIGAESATFAYLFDTPQMTPRLLLLVDKEASCFSYEHPHELIARLELAHESAMRMSTQGAIGPAGPPQSPGDPVVVPILDVPALSAWSTSSGGLLRLTFAGCRLEGGRIDMARYLIARGASTTLQEWFDRRLQKDFIGASHVTDDEVALLRLELDGFCTKAIARRLRTSSASINSRFQRLNRKLGTRSRRSSLELAAAHGLIAQPRTMLKHRPVTWRRSSLRSDKSSATEALPRPSRAA